MFYGWERKYKTFTNVQMHNTSSNLSPEKLLKNCIHNMAYPNFNWKMEYMTEELPHFLRSNPTNKTAS
jgi:hypothetical protein